MKNERGFTLIEMLVVLLIISVLILVTIPNVTKHSAMIDDKGCEAYLQMLQGQMETYKIENRVYPTMDQLKGEAYLNIKGDSDVECPNGKAVEIEDGKVFEKKSTS